jgi:trk system potassium uptake protein TrkH
MKLINPLIIIKILGAVMLFMTISFLACLPVSIIFDEPPGPFLISALVSGIACILFRVVGRKAEIKSISNRDGYLSVVLSWLLMASAGAMPFIFSGAIPSFIQAFFESSSGFTTTGASAVKDLGYLPSSILFWRNFTQWLGGLGIIIMITVILPALKILGLQQFSVEPFTRERLHSGTRSFLLSISLVYAGLTFSEVLFLAMGDMNLFDSICHSFGTVSTGGFSTRNDSLQSFSSYSQYIVMIFMFLAGISHLVYYNVLRLRFSKVKHNEELRFYTGTVIAAGLIIIIILTLFTGNAFPTVVRDGLFQVDSIISTTGFISANLSCWPASALLLIFLLYFSGACTGSTTGGIKMARHLVVIKNIRSVFTKLNHQNVVTQVKLNRNPLPENVNTSAISFLLLYVIVFFTGSLLVALSGSDPVTSASSVASCLGNIGPALGNAGDVTVYANMPGKSLFILSMLMIVGRLEIFAVFALFSKTFWKL